MSFQRCQRGSEIVARDGIARVDSKRLFVVSDGPLNAAKRLQGITDIVVNFGKIGSERQRLLVMTDRLVMALLASQRHAEVKLNVRGSAFNLARSAEQTDGVIEPTLLESDQTQTIECIEMAAIRPEHAFVS